MKLNTRVFGEIEIADEKIITFANGIIGFPDLKKFTLIYDEEYEKEERIITWMQSLDDPKFALPVMNPLLIDPAYNPYINDELLKAVGNVTNENACILVTINVPKDIVHMAVNFKAPIIINVDERKGTQVIVEDEYEVHHEIYEFLKSMKEKEGK